MGIVLYHRRGSRSGRVKMMLDLTELPYDLRTVDTAAGEHKAPDYLGINPFGVVPTMVHDDQVLLESGAMMMHIADLAPDKGWAPAPGSALRGQYYTWFMLSIVTIEPICMAYLRKPEEPGNAEAFRHATRVLEERIAMPYCLPGQISAVDIMVHWNFRFLLSTNAGADMHKARRYYDGLTSVFDWTDY